MNTPNNNKSLKLREFNNRFLNKDVELIKEILLNQLRLQKKITGSNHYTEISIELKNLLVEISNTFSEDYCIEILKELKQEYREFSKFINFLWVELSILSKGIKDIKYALSSLIFSISDIIEMHEYFIKVKSVNNQVIYDPVIPFIHTRQFAGQKLEYYLKNNCSRRYPVNLKKAIALALNKFHIYEFVVYSKKFGVKKLKKICALFNNQFDSYSILTMILSLEKKMNHSSIQTLLISTL